VPPPGNQYLEARIRWVPEIGYLLEIHAGRFAELERDLYVGSECSEAIPKIPAALRRKPILCFISTKRGLLTHVGRAEVRYAAQTGFDRLELWNVKPFAQPIRKGLIRQNLSGKQSWRARRDLETGGHMSAGSFSQNFAALKQASPEAYAVADSLIDRRLAEPDPEPTPEKVNWAYQRDAVVTALEIAGFPKDRLQVPAQFTQSTKTKVTSIFDEVGDVYAMEDHVILQDMDAGGPEWKAEKAKHYPARVFTNGETVLTVILANKEELEKQLGVDLIYINERYRAVVFVQYKMFEGKDGEEGYRPNQQLADEIARMDAAAATLTNIPADESCDGYRLGLDPFFLKFCSRLLTHDDVGHVPGHYLPLGYWKRLAADDRVKGKRGGVRVDKYNLGRHFSPTAFIDLVAKGWIGTSALQADVLIPYLMDALRGKKGVVLAIESQGPPDDDSTVDSIPTRAPPPKRKPGKTAPVLQI
jgi:hypothetical protein